VGTSTANASSWLLFGVEARGDSPSVELVSAELEIVGVDFGIGGVSRGADGDRIAARECGDGMAAVVGGLRDPVSCSHKQNWRGCLGGL